MLHDSVMGKVFETSMIIFYDSNVSCPPPGDLPNPGIELRFPTLQANSFPPEPPGKPNCDPINL